MCNVCNFLLLGNCHNCFAVTAYEAGNDEVVGHIPREISRWSALFLDCRGSIEGSIVGVRRHSREAGGMKIPCLLMFIGKKNHIAEDEETYRRFEQHCCVCIELINKHKSQC